jgi:Uma2 family endonuclease
MSIISQSLPAVDAVRETAPGETFYPLTVEQYHEMIRVGILDEDDPVELLDGLLVQKMSKNPPHRAGVKLLRDALERVIPPGWYVDSQEPVTLFNSEPEPDGVVVRGAPRDFLDRHPGPDDVGLLAEVSADSLKRDRGWKLRLYAKAGILVYWIINLVDRQVEVFQGPSGPTEHPTYSQQQVFRPGEEIPLVIDGKEIARVRVDDLLP